MTFAEIFIFIMIVGGFCLLLKPLQRRLEARLYRLFTSGQKGDRAPIDIKKYTILKDK